MSIVDSQTSLSRRFEPDWRDQKRNISYRPPRGMFWLMLTITKWGCSSYGRAFDLHSKGNGINTRLLQSTSNIVVVYPPSKRTAGVRFPVSAFAFVAKLVQGT